MLKTAKGINWTFELEVVETHGRLPELYSRYQPIGSIEAMLQSDKHTDMQP